MKGGIEQGAVATAASQQKIEEQTAFALRYTIVEIIEWLMAA